MTSNPERFNVIDKISLQKIDYVQKLRQKVDITLWKHVKLIVIIVVLVVISTYLFFS